MARVYTSRQLLDPSILQMRQQADDAYLQRLQQQRQNFYNSLQTGTNTLGKAIGQGIDAYRDYTKNQEDIAKRRDLLGNYNLQGTEEAAIGEEYVRTGDPSKLLTLRQIKEANEARKAQLEEAKLERMKNETMHKRVALAQVRPVYEEIQNKMFDAIDAGDFETASIQKSKLEAIETEFGSEPFGQSAASVMENRKKTKEEKDAALVDEETKRLAKQDQEMYSLRARTKIESNVLPNMKTIDDKGNYKKMVTSMWQNGRLTDEDAKALLSKIENTKTLGEKVIEAGEDAVASSTGENTKKGIEDAKNKKSAQAYVGKKLNSLEWNKIPEEVKAFLKRDAIGNVEMK